MTYPIAIKHEPGKACGVQVPDLPGCFSAGDTLDEAISNSAEALAFHIEGLLDAGEKIPPPQSQVCPFRSKGFRCSRQIV